METIFSLSATEGNSEGRSSLASAKPQQRPIMHEIQITDVEAHMGRPSLKRKKIEIVQEDGYISTVTNANQKTMMQTDAEKEADDDKQATIPKKMQTRSKSPVERKENEPAVDHLMVPQLRKRSNKASEKTTQLTLQQTKKSEALIEIKPEGMFGHNASVIESASVMVKSNAGFQTKSNRRSGRVN